MSERVHPPEDIAPREFFTRWVPEAVASDAERRRKLGDAHATIHFELLGEGGGDWAVQLAGGEVRGVEGRPARSDLHVRLDVPTWRELNRGGLSAPEAMLRRRVKLRGDLLLAIKLHFILG
ncbi:MAG TPA: SCP2 sterol-binding domain-containing protein [Myxococcota bacterium]|nr:SCP2 sterol-binding domain-containing protein [Myxococcota bacterium]